VRPPVLGWAILVGGVILGAVTVALVALLFAAPYRADARIWRSVALDSARCSDRSGKIFNPRTVEPTTLKRLPVDTTRRTE
jgi:hypothetical protein